ncbi:hypothetical protein L9F63_009863, partial [Diploptera punctata]
SFPFPTPLPILTLGITCSDKMDTCSILSATSRIKKLLNCHHEVNRYTTKAVYIEIESYPGLSFYLILFFQQNLKSETSKLWLAGLICSSSNIIIIQVRP